MRISRRTRELSSYSKGMQVDFLIPDDPVPKRGIVAKIYTKKSGELFVQAEADPEKVYPISNKFFISPRINT